MPNQHRPDREPIGIMLPRTTMVRLRKYARRQALPTSVAAVNILTAAVQDEPLNSQDYDAIAQATKKAEETGQRSSTKPPSAS